MVECNMRKKTDKPFDVIRWARDLADDDFIEPAAGEPPMLMMVSLSGDGFRRLAMINKLRNWELDMRIHNRLYSVRRRGQPFGAGPASRGEPRYAAPRRDDVIGGRLGAPTVPSRLMAAMATPRDLMGSLPAGARGLITSRLSFLSGRDKLVLGVLWR